MGNRNKRMFEIRLFLALLCWLFLFVMPNSLTQAKNILPGSINARIGMNHGMPIMLAKAKKAYYEHTIKGSIPILFMLAGLIATLAGFIPPTEKEETDG